MLEANIRPKPCERTQNPTKYVVLAESKKDYGSKCEPDTPEEGN